MDLFRSFSIHHTVSKKLYVDTTPIRLIFFLFLNSICTCFDGGGGGEATSY